MRNVIRIMGDSPSYADALQGVWGYEGKRDYFLTIVKGVAHLETVISDVERDFELVLPNCYDFLAQVNSLNGCRFVKVTNSVLNVRLAAFEQINTNFKLK